VKDIDVDALRADMEAKNKVAIAAGEDARAKAEVLKQKNLALAEAKEAADKANQALLAAREASKAAGDAEELGWALAIAKQTADGAKEAVANATVANDLAQDVLAEAEAVVKKVTLDRDKLAGEFNAATEALAVAMKAVAGAEAVELCNVTVTPEPTKPETKAEPTKPETKAETKVVAQAEPSKKATLPNTGASTDGTMMASILTILGGAGLIGASRYSARHRRDA
ncbi:MAG: LPXTG cell wall anchor domain-containing protein, partial [Trueperella sp.]|uniref:LPXTG cell wall anchor domain-containing protein n=2 Tax=Trueperella sp. TaxID=2699835 RepID=UPI0025E735DC